jgi:hypothetical protein
MYRTILCAAAAGVVIFSLPAKADETVKWRHVVRITSPTQNQRVDDVERHFMGVLRAEGTATFPDGSTGAIVVIDTYDIVYGSGGTENGYTSLTFADGSELRFKFADTIKYGEKSVVNGTAIVVSGKGRYAGAKGDGAFEGEITSGPPDVTAQFDSVINVKK